MLLKNTKIQMFFSILCFSIFVLLFSSVSFVLAADDNANEPMCSDEEYVCDDERSECVCYGFTWETNGYPSGAGNPQCCGDDSLE